jgi:hypothetical protein
MTHQEKVEHYLNDLAHRGISKGTAAPPLYRLLWRLGIEVPPPLLASFGSLAVMWGVLFGVGWGLIMWFTFWRDNMPPAIALISSLFAGATFGVIMAAYYRWRASKLALPRWEDYPPQ